MRCQVLLIAFEIRNLPYDPRRLADHEIWVRRHKILRKVDNLGQCNAASRANLAIAPALARGSIRTHRELAVFRKIHTCSKFVRRVGWVIFLLAISICATVYNLFKP